MNSGKADLLAGAAGTTVFLGTLVGLGWPVGVCLLMTGASYLGLNLLLRSGADKRLGNSRDVAGLSLEEMKLAVAQEEKTVQELRRLAGHIGREPIRDKVLSVCDICDKIFQNFRDDPEDLREAERFLFHFRNLLPIVQNYVHLSSDADRSRVLTAEDEAGMQKMLDSLESNLRDAYQAFQENNLQKLRIATRVLQRTIELDGTDIRERR